MASQITKSRFTKQNSNKTTPSDNMIYKNNGRLSRVNQGNVVKDYKIGNTRIKICDDYYRNQTEVDIEAILDRISGRTQKQLSAQEYSKKTK